MAIITFDQQIQCVTAEWERRVRFFPKFVAAGKMEQDRATAEIAAMDAVRQTLTQLRGLLGGSPSDQQGRG